MKVSITIETEMGMTWPLWKRIVPELEAMGLATIFRSDHFPLGVPGVTDSLELITSLTYLAEHTRRVDFGTLVAPLSFHDPVALARQAMSLNDLSDGRMILGLGSGWVESEHQVYGYTLGDIKTRLDRLEEGLRGDHWPGTRRTAPHIPGEILPAGKCPSAPPPEETYPHSDWR